MELKTDGGIYLTKEEYRKNVTKVMNRQRALALAAVIGTVLEGEIDPKQVEDGVNQALSLQVQALESMERLLFGKPSKKAKDEEAEKDD